MIVRNDYNKQSIAESMAELWKPLSKEQREYIVDNIKICFYNKNEVLYHETESPEYMMCLLKGKVKVYKDGCERNQIIRVINQMGFFGYSAAFDEGEYHASASALEESEVCMIPIKVIKKVIAENAKLAMFFIKQVSIMLREADILTINLTQKHIRGRLAEALLVLKDKYGVEEDGSTLSIYLSRENLANMSNMTTSNAIRTLSSFSTEHLIAIDGRKIKIINEEELNRVSKLG